MSSLEEKEEEEEREDKEASCLSWGGGGEIHPHEIKKLLRDIIRSVYGSGFRSGGFTSSRLAPTHSSRIV